MRVVALFGLAEASVLDAAVGACEGKGGTTCLCCADVWTTCNAVTSWWAMSSTRPTIRSQCSSPTAWTGALQSTGRDGAIPNSSKARLGERDHTIVLDKPKHPDWVSGERYAQAPQRLTTRNWLSALGPSPPRHLVPKAVPKAAGAAPAPLARQTRLAQPQAHAWYGPVTRPHRSPAMAEKELWASLLAHNLIRLLIAQTALHADQVSRQLSFNHAVQLWLAWLRRGSDPNDAVAMHSLLLFVAQPRVGRRPEGIEPRLVQRRHKRFGLLTEPRERGTRGHQTRQPPAPTGLKND